MGCSHHFFFKKCREKAVVNKAQVSPTIPPFDCYQTAYLLRLRAFMQICLSMLICTCNWPMLDRGCLLLSVVSSVKKKRI